jgi:hypothetical protein
MVVMPPAGTTAGGVVAMLAAPWALACEAAPDVTLRGRVLLGRGPAARLRLSCGCCGGGGGAHVAEGRRRRLRHHGGLRV